MNRIHFLVPLVGVGVAALTMVSCGDNTQSGYECGPGTSESDGTCIPDTTTTCGAGTTVVGNQCVPNGTVICDQGTAYNPTSGQCEVDATACADGTVLLAGVCVPEDETLVADHDEAAEPNDATRAGTFAVPALNQMTTIHGCITPRAGVADVDAWIVTATGPTVLEITADGVGGLAAAFVVSDINIAVLPNYFRFGINLTGDTSRRQVYLPVAGSYALEINDSRALFLPEAVGNGDTCYYATIQQVALPTATPVTLPETTGTDAGDVRVLRYQADAIGDIFDITEVTDGVSPMAPAFIVRKNGEFYASAAAYTYEENNVETTVMPFYSVGGLETTDTIEVVVDSTYNWGITPQAYTFEFVDIAAQRLPTNGDTITATKKNGTMAETSWWEPNFFYFDVATAGQVVHFNLTQSVASPGVTMWIARRDIFTPSDYDAVAEIGTRLDFVNQEVRFLRPGRYYLVVTDDNGTGGETYTVTSTLTPITPTVLTYGTALSAQPLPSTRVGFHTLDLTNVNWLEVAVPTAANWGVGNSARVTLFDLAGEGWMGPGDGANYEPVQDPAEQPVDGTAPLGRITMGDARDFLVRVENTGTPDLNPAYDLVARERSHVFLGMSVAGTPILRTALDTVVANGTMRYLVTGTPQNTLQAILTPSQATVDINVVQRNADESAATTINDGGDGVAETLDGKFATTPSWVAFTVTNLNGTTASNINLVLNSLLPPYVASSGTLAYVNACSGTGSVQFPAPFDGNGDDEYSAVQTLPFAFNFFGEPVSQFVIAANGLLSFGATDPDCLWGCYTNDEIPNVLAPNSFLAPYWDDLAAITVCRKDEAGKVTIQWTGEIYEFGGGGNRVAFQVVLHQTTGAIDFIYGAEHAASGDSATVGAENTDADLSSIQLVHNEAGMVLPNTSRTLTPTM